jgi:hypothetical protein
VISGTCVAAHNSAATWMMNVVTGSPFLISLMATVASLPFFLFTLPAGVLADKVNRQKFVCGINLWLPTTFNLKVRLTSDSRLTVCAMIRTDMQTGWVPNFHTEEIPMSAKEYQPGKAQQTRRATSEWQSKTDL